MSEDINVLVLVSAYPNDGNPYNCMWAHTRSLYYANNGINVLVAVPGLGGKYTYDGIDVVPLSSIDPKTVPDRFDLVISHSPNIRAHIPFLLRLQNLPIILFMHGTESMRRKVDYPTPYDYQKPSILGEILSDWYDIVKFFILNRFIWSRRSSIHIVCVSDWMRKTFFKNVMKAGPIEDISVSVINNSLNGVFFEKEYTPAINFEADFVTLRRLDHSKYCIDLLVAHARKNPNLTFHIFGDGDYFDHNSLPENCTWFKEHVKPENIPDLLNHYRAAFMPTRCDAQGVMVCEMATYGIPVITSDIPVKREMLKNFGNVLYISNEEVIDLSTIMSSGIGVADRHSFKPEFNVLKEVSLIKHKVGLA